MGARGYGLFTVACFCAGIMAFGSVCVPFQADAKPRQAKAFRIAGQVVPRTVFVQMFSWKWTDIALECETLLGPYGFAAVQVSPPNEHAVYQGHPWWERYQPVSYRLESRSGTHAEFIDMVKRCRAVGVDVYVDTVINHMADDPMEGQTRIGFAGTRYTRGHIEGLYSPWDFHYCGRYGDNGIRNYGDRWEVQHCNIYRTNDLNTESEYVRGRLAGYLDDLLHVGVTGFRVDAAKHMAADDVVNILGRLSAVPYVVHEVIGSPGEPIQPREYYSTGDINEFDYARNLGRVFREGKLAWLQSFGEAWGMMPSDKAVVFATNHDTERNERNGQSPLTYKDGQLYVLGNIFMLAWPYGYPQLFSGYRFDSFDQGPPTLPDGSVKPVYSGADPVGCFKEWNCDHRWPSIARMVAFRNYTSSDFSISKWWTDGNGRIAFARGTKGFVAINRDGGELRNDFDTGLPAGEYCDIISGVPVEGATGCSGQRIVVDARGHADIFIRSMNAVAIFGAARLRTR